MLARIVVLFLFFLLGGGLFLTALCGREYARTRDSQYLASHKVCAVFSLILMVGAVVSVELLSYFRGPLGEDPMRAIHLSTAIPFSLLFVLLFFFLTGERAPRCHKLLVYVCLVLFAIAFIPGAVMLLDIRSLLSF